MTPLPDTNTGPQIVFYPAVAVLVLLEQRTRLRGLLHRVGSRSDRGSLLAIAAVGADSTAARFAGRTAGATDAYGTTVPVNYPPSARTS